MGTDKYTCADCKGIFLKAWSDAEARAEYEATQPKAAERGDETDTLCGNCFEEFLAWAADEGIDL